MTSAELRRLADHKVVEASSLSRDADHLRSKAAALKGLLDPLVPISQRIWVGPAALDFEEKSAQHAQTIDNQAAQLLQIAGEFEDQVRELRNRAAELRAEAQTADTAAAAAVVPTGVI